MDMSKYRDMFVQEALEHINNLNNTLLEFEKHKSREELDALFRSAHTIKGMAATMGYENITVLCRSIEDLFDDLRNQKIEFTKDMADLLFNAFDLLERLVIDERFTIDIEQFTKAFTALRNREKGNNVNTMIDSKAQGEILSTISVKLKDLDRLVDLVGELVVIKMRLEQILKDSNTLNSTMISLDRVVSDLQYATMKLRLVPLDTVINRFQRVVRDTASRVSKEVEFKIEGGNIEVDRAILQAITDPLLHILRNAVDHGIEEPDERERLGKCRKGQIRLSAERSGERVIITVEDDGKGIDLEAIKKKAIEKGFISKEEASRLRDDEIYNLLTFSGLSTAKEVTDISGRGVGMNVVFKQVERVGGYVKIDSKMGIGTKIIISIPLNISIISGLLVTISNERYVIPLSSVITTTIVSTDEIKYMHGRRVIIINGEIIPLIDISNIASNTNDRLSVVVVNKNSKHLGIVVDSFEYKQEVVIKHIASALNSKEFPDATIDSDGNPVLILDPVLAL